MLLAYASEHDVAVQVAADDLGPKIRNVAWIYAAKLATRAIFQVARAGHRGPLRLIRACAADAIARRDIE